MNRSIADCTAVAAAAVVVGGVFIAAVAAVVAVVVGEKHIGKFMYRLCASTELNFYQYNVNKRTSILGCPSF